MLNRTAYSRFPPYAPFERSSRKTCVQRRECGGCEVPVACNLRTGASLLLVAAITSCVLFIHSGAPLVAAAGSLRARSDQGAEGQADDSSLQKPGGRAPAPWMLKDVTQATPTSFGSHVAAPSSSRGALRDASSGASRGPTPETGEHSRQPRTRGAAHPGDFFAQAAEGAEKEEAALGIPHYDVKARADIRARLADEGKREGGPVTEDPLAGKNEVERHFQHWHAKLYPAQGVQRAGDETRKGKDARGGSEVAKLEGGPVAGRTAFPKKEAKAKVERTQAEEEHEENAKWMQPGAGGEHRMDYGAEQVKRQGGEEGKREKKEDVKKKKEEEDKRAERKEEGKRQSSKVTDEIQIKLRPASEKKSRSAFENEGRVAFEKGGHPAYEKEGGPASEKEGRPASEKEGRPAAEEVGQQKEKGVQPVYTRSFFSDHPFCLFPNSPWCSSDLTAKDAKSPENIPNVIRRANAIVSSMLPLPFFYIPLPIPRFWSAGEATSVESATAPRCRFIFTVPAMGPSEEVLLYMIPSQRLVGLTVGRNVKHSEKTDTYSRVFDTETRMHAVSSFVPECKASDRYLQAGLIGWSYAGKTDKCVKILVTLPSEPHAKELMERKVLSEETYKKFVEEEGLDQLTPSEKCVLSGRTQDECEQLRVEAGAKRVPPITVSEVGYAQNEVRIPEFVYK